MMIVEFDPECSTLVGVNGNLEFPPGDKVIRKLAMLIEGECGEKTVTETVQKFGFSRQRYYQLRQDCRLGGVAALQEQNRGPKTNYRRTEETVRRIIRYKFLDAELSAEVIAQKLQQQGVQISIRSVQRVITEYGLQKGGSTD
jgi:hypothetical protein